MDDELLQRAAAEDSKDSPVFPDIGKAMQEGWSTASAEARNSGFGAGMGLPNMKRNSDNMKIETELGVGTTVTMTILFGGEAS